jgi:hypothetical protein
VRKKTQRHEILETPISQVVVPLVRTSPRYEVGTLSSATESGRKSANTIPTGSSLSLEGNSETVITRVVTPLPGWRSIKVPCFRELLEGVGLAVPTVQRPTPSSTKQELPVSSVNNLVKIRPTKPSPGSRRKSSREMQSGVCKVDARMTTEGNEDFE